MNINKVLLLLFIIIVTSLTSCTLGGGASSLSVSGQEKLDGLYLSDKEIINSKPTTMKGNEGRIKLDEALLNDNLNPTSTGYNFNIGFGRINYEDKKQNTENFLKYLYGWNLQLNISANSFKDNLLFAQNSLATSLYFKPKNDLNLLVGPMVGIGGSLNYANRNAIASSVVGYSPIVETNPEINEKSKLLFVNTKDNYEVYYSSNSLLLGIDALYKLIGSEDGINLSLRTNLGYGITTSSFNEVRLENGTIDITNQAFTNNSKFKDLTNKSSYFIFSLGVLVSFYGK